MKSLPGLLAEAVLGGVNTHAGDPYANRRKQAPSITCPDCGRTSYHPEDIRHGYCGACHDYTHGEVKNASD